MYKQFNLSSIIPRALEKRIDLKFNFDIDESSIKGDSINLVTLKGGDHINFKTVVKNDLISLLLDEWPKPDTVYHVIIEQEIKNITGQKLNSAIRRKLIFKSEITSVPIIKSPYQHEKLEDLNFEWVDKDNNESYYIEVAKENRFYNLVYSGDVYTNSISPVLPELKPGQYYVRVRVQDGKEYGRWSPIVTFIYKDVCYCDEPENPGPSADAEMPSAWDNLFDNTPDSVTPGSSSVIVDDSDNMIDVEDELEVLTAPENGVTPTSFVFEFDKNLNNQFGEVIVIKREF